MSIELRFRELLNKHDNLNDVTEELLNLAASRKIKYQQIAKITNFLINAGLYEDAFRQYPRRFYERSKITWPQFIEILYQTNTKLEESTLQAIVEGVKYKQKISSLVTNSHWQHYSQVFLDERKQLWNKKAEDVEKKKDALKQKLDFLKTNRMLAEEERTYKKYLTMFPDDEEIQASFDEFKERWAREIISRKIESGKNKVDYKTLSHPELTKEEEQICQCILQEVQKFIKINKNSAYDYALLFYSFEYFDGALKLLNEAPEDYKGQWLKAELYFENKQYLDLLNFLEELQQLYPEDPEAQFAATYLRARALNSLGHRARAIELLNNIISVRPLYRSAQSLVAEWSMELI